MNTPLRDEQIAATLARYGLEPGDVEVKGIRYEPGPNRAGGTRLVKIVVSGPKIPDGAQLIVPDDILNAPVPAPPEPARRRSLFD